MPAMEDGAGGLAGETVGTGWVGTGWVGTPFRIDFGLAMGPISLPHMPSPVYCGALDAYLVTVEALPARRVLGVLAVAELRTAVVLETGGPVLMPWLHDVNGVLETWYPGQQFGDAIAAVLFGDANPGGRLPVTFPASDAQGPAPATQPQHYPGVDGVEHYDEGLDVGYRWYDATGQRPLFPFGYGLSYEQFQVSRQMWSIRNRRL